MKKLFSILLIISLLITFCACSSDDSDDVYTPPPTPQEIPPTVQPPPVQPPPVVEPEQPTSMVLIYDGVKLAKSNGVDYAVIEIGKSANARDGWVSVGDILHGLDETGVSVVTDRLPCEPDAIAIGANTWTFENIDPATAYSLGALPKWYTKMWRNSDEFGLWYNNQWQTVDAFVTESNDVVFIDTVGKYRFTGNLSLPVQFASHGGIFIYDTDAETLRANIRTASGDWRVAFTQNAFLGADQWQKAGNVFYSWNGYVWNDSELIENATVLQSFIISGPDAPVVVSAGARAEHGEAVTYWIECCSGWLYRHTPSIDSLEQVSRLWMGSGERLDGVNCAKVVNPVMTDENLFFKVDETVWKYNFTGGIVSSFATGVTVWGL